MDQDAFEGVRVVELAQWVFVPVAPDSTAVRTLRPLLPASFYEVSRVSLPGRIAAGARGEAPRRQSPKINAEAGGCLARRSERQ